MKTIGLLGGTSWPSTFSYYELLNRAAQKALGGHHSARILLYSIDYHPIKSLYHDGWDKIPALLAEEVRFFLAKGPDCLIICNNTLHRAFDQIRDSLNITIPVFHAGHLAAEEAQRQGHKTVLLLGTAFTMEDGFFAKYFEDRGIKVMIPNAEDRKSIQDIQSELALGNLDPSYPRIFAAMLKRYAEVDAIILACTELPLAINETSAPKPLINPIHCQCEAAAGFVFGSRR
ncbi:MAG: amino acid racemase [Alphaproteobacteria bacterium]